MNINEVSNLVGAVINIQETPKITYQKLCDIKLPPFDKWTPKLCENVFITIDKQGRWLHNGSVITRQNIVSLFASVLTKEGDNHILKTPHEKIVVTVEDHPFFITTWERKFSKVGEMPTIVFTTNVGESYELNDIFSLIQDQEEKQHLESPLSLNIKNGLTARLGRNVYYQLLEILQECEIENGQYKYFIVSGSYRFELK